MLRVKYGWEGEGKFWALNNRIAESENCELNLSKKYNKASIANDLDFTLESFDEFLEYLENDCDLIIKEDNHITTEIIREVLLGVMEERKRNKQNYEKRNIQDVTKGKTQPKPVEIEIKHVENIQRKGKESKVKESRGKLLVPEYLELAELLQKKILKNIPTFKVTDTQTKQWSDVVRLMVEQDNYTLEQIKFLIEWCQQDTFWFKNILSMGKLRKQFDRLTGESSEKAKENSYGKDRPGNKQLVEDEGKYDNIGTTV